MSFCCLTSAEARRPIRDGDEWVQGGQKSDTEEQREGPLGLTAMGRGRGTRWGGRGGAALLLPSFLKKCRADRVYLLPERDAGDCLNSSFSRQFTGMGF